MINCPLCDDMEFVDGRPCPMCADQHQPETTLGLALILLLLVCSGAALAWLV